MNQKGHKGTWQHVSCGPSLRSASALRSEDVLVGIADGFPGRWREPRSGVSNHTQVKVHDNPHALVAITGPTEAAVMRRTGTWLEELDGAVVVVSTNWRGDVSELDGSSEEFLYQLDLTVDMSIAVDEGRWPRDWFRS